MQNRTPLLQQRLEALGIAARTSEALAPSLDKPRLAAVRRDGNTAAWDPHEVWLERIHMPREQRRPA